MRLEHLSKSVDGDRLLSDVNLSIFHSTFHCLLIPNPNSRSCLVNILRGILTADNGLFYVNDKVVVSTKLREHGIACVFKKSSLIAQKTIAENIFLTDDPYYRFGLTRLTLMSSIAGLLLQESGIQHVKATHPAGGLKTFDAHKIEIVSAISKGVQTIFLDNIAEQYTDNEMYDMWQLIDYLIKTGITVIMISPRYNFFFDYAHYTTILDRGSPVITLPRPDNSRERMLNYLHISEPTVIENKNVKSQRVLRLRSQKPLQNDFDISVHRGEIVGVYDKDRSVSESLINTLSGLDRHSIEITINEQLTRIDTKQISTKKGVALIHEGSEYSQIFTNMSLSKNITILMDRPLYNRLGFRSHVVEQFITRHTLQMLKCGYLLDRYEKNKDLPPLPWHEQIKIIVARWLCCNPQVFVFINPLLDYADVTAHEFHNLVSILKDNGYGILIVSSSIDDLRRICAA